MGRGDYAEKGDCPVSGRPVADALRKRLGLPDCVDYTEYDGRVAGSDATFFCKECKSAIMGCHPRCAGPQTASLA